MPGFCIPRHIKKRTFGPSIWIFGPLLPAALVNVIFRGILFLQPCLFLFVVSLPLQPATPGFSRNTPLPYQIKNTSILPATPFHSIEKYQNLFWNAAIKSQHGVFCKEIAPCKRVFYIIIKET